MSKRVHIVAGLLAPLCMATFFLSTVVVELFGSHDAVARVKALIVTPGLWILIPALMVTAGSGVFLSRSRRGRLVDAKKKRMPLIAANGLLVLVPCALFLSRQAAGGTFDTAFHVVQGIELLAGAVNLALMALNVRDGLRLAGRLRQQRPHAAPGNEQSARLHRSRGG